MTIDNKGVRTFELWVRTTAMLPPDVSKVDDLSDAMQTALMTALDRKAKEVELPLVVVYVQPDVDFDGKPGLHVVASEIVAGPADRRGAKGGYLDRN